MSNNTTTFDIQSNSTTYLINTNQPLTSFTDSQLIQFGQLAALFLVIFATAYEYLQNNVFGQKEGQLYRRSELESRYKLDQINLKEMNPVEPDALRDLEPRNYEDILRQQNEETPGQEDHEFQGGEDQVDTSIQNLQENKKKYYPAANIIKKRQKEKYERAEPEKIPSKKSFKVDNEGSMTQQQKEKAAMKKLVNVSSASASESEYGKQSSKSMKSKTKKSAPKKSKLTPIDSEQEEDSD